jgi:hypothetical protein
MFIAVIGSSKKALVVAVVVIAVVTDGDIPRGQFGLLENGTSTVVLKTIPSGEYRESYIIPGGGGGGSALILLLEVEVVAMMLLLALEVVLKGGTVGEGEQGCNGVITVLWLLAMVVLFAKPRLMT